MSAPDSPEDRPPNPPADPFPPVEGDDGGLRLKILLGGVILLFVLIFVVVIILVVTRERQPVRQGGLPPRVRGIEQSRANTTPGERRFAPS